MSLLSDPDFLIHNLRLNYLRSVEDPYGPRLISLSPSYTSNPYILASNLADVERWPELTVTSSPAPSDDENERGLGLDGGSPPGAPQQSSSGLANLNHHHERNGHDGVTDGDGRRGRPTGFPGATGLKYTTTIMGANRSGTMGLRVSGGGGEKRGDARKAARRASARFERRRLSDGMGVGGRLEEASVLEASDEDREGSRSDGSEESRAGPVGVNIIGPSDGGEASIIPKLTPPPPDVGAISGKVVNHHGGSGLNLPTSSSPPHHKYSPSEDQTQATGALLKTISSSSAGSTSGAATATPPKAVGFIPNFKGAAEMEARRRLRLQARGRGGPGGLGVGTRGGAQPTQPLSLRDIDTSSSSSSEPEPPSDVEGDKAHTSDEDTSGHLPADSYSDVLAAGEDSAEEDGFDSAPVIDGSMDLAHEFDPEFSATRGGVNLGSGSDIASMLSMSHSLMSTPSGSVHNPSGIHGRKGTRLSPVTEHGIRDAARLRSRSNSDRNGSRYHRRNSGSSINGSHHTHHSDHHHKHSTGGGTGDNSTSGSRHHHSSHHSSSGPKPDELTFPRKKVPPIRPVKSALTAMLAKTSSSSNPFEEYYAAISGRAEGESKMVAVYFPKATKPKGQVMELNVRKDAMIEEVLGHALYKYWEEGWLPKIDEGLEGEEDPKWSTVCSAVGWILRIAEEDGEADEDFPPPDRTGKISKFNFAYAVSEASAAQIQQNRTLESKIQRRPSRIMGRKKKQNSDGSSLGVTSLLAPGTSATPSPLGISPAFGSLVSMPGPQMFLRIRVAETADAVHISTTIPVTSGMYMQEALEAVCKKRKLDPNEYALLVRDMSVLILLDRTVASLEGKSDLVLVKRSMLPRYGIVDTGKSMRTTDPNASIFKRMSETPGSQNSVTDYTGAYKKYIITRKLPMLVGRHERILAIDGVYLHIMPSAKRATGMFETGRTSSYHIRCVVACQQSAKSSSSFKLVVQRDGGTKRYDFEAENPKVASEIVQNVRSIKTAVERSGTFSKSRRSKQVV